MQTLSQKKKKNCTLVLVYEPPPILTFPEMSSSEPDKAVPITFLSRQSQHCLHPLFSAVTHIHSMMKHFLKSLSVWQDMSHPQRASHDISVCVWASVSSANPVGTWRHQAPNGPHHFPLTFSQLLM